MSNHKVLHIISHPGLGGAQTLLKTIIENTNNHYLYCLRKDKVDIFNDLNQVHYYSSYKSYKFNPFILINLYRIIKKYNFKILHLHLGKPLIYAYIIKIFDSKIKIVYHEHGKIFNQNCARIYRIYLNMFKGKVNLFIAVSKATKQKLMENAGIPEEKIKVLYNFIDPDKFNSESLKKYNRDKEREKLGLRREDFIIGFAGRLSKVKGCEYLIKSIPYIKNIPNFKVLIAGDGIERKKLEKLAENLNIKEKIIFLGYVKEILNFYEIIDVLVVPSKFEASPMIFYESHALGIPMIASNVAALNEFIKNNENGLLFEFANEKDLAEKIELIYMDEKLKKKLIKNELDDIKKYSLDEYSLKINNLCYKNLGEKNE